MFCCLFCALAAAQWAAVWKLLKSGRPAGACPRCQGGAAVLPVPMRRALLTAATLFTLAVGLAWQSGALASLDDAVLASRPVLMRFSALCRGVMPGG